MATKDEKKKRRLEVQLSLLETDLKNTLQKKVSTQAEIDLPARLRKIEELKKQIAAL